MNEKLTGVLAGLKQEPVDALAVSDLRHPPIVVEELERLRQWLGIASDGSAICPKMVGLVLGFGVEGALRIHASYAEATARTTQESDATFEALRLLARQAKAMRIVSWSLDGDVRPYTSAQGKPKLLVELEPSTDERLRRAAGKRGESLRQFAESAILDRLALIERRPRSRPKRARSSRAEPARPAAPPETVASTTA